MRHKPLAYTATEKKELVISSLILGLVGYLFSFRYVGTNTIIEGVGQLLFYIFIFAVALLIFSGTAKVIGHKKGLYSEYERWKSGQVFSIILIIITAGIVPLFFGGVNNLSANMRVRHGKIFPEANKKEIFQIGLSSIFGVILWAATLRLLANVIGTKFFVVATYAVTLLAVFLLLPAPKSQGGALFFINKTNYIKNTGIFLILCFMIFVNSILAVLIILLLIVIAYAIFKKAKK
jgi:hypothetical protein